MATKATPPDFGPGGYLPPKAAKRARKIVLREQMGFGWPLAAVAAAVLVAVAGGAYLYVSTRAPAAPFVQLQPLAEVPVGGATTLTNPGAAALVVRAGGSVRAFEAVEGVAWCPQSRRLESANAAWTPDGRLVAGPGASLQPLRSTVYDGVVYVDFSSGLEPLPPTDSGDPPACGADSN